MWYPFDFSGEVAISDKIGRRVRSKHFLFREKFQFIYGVVDECDKKHRYFHVAYDDGDGEEYSLSDLLPLLHTGLLLLNSNFSFNLSLKL